MKKDTLLDFIDLNDINAEMSVISFVLLDFNVIHKIKEYVKTQDYFFENSLQNVYYILLQIAENSQFDAIDLKFIANEYKSKFLDSEIELNGKKYKSINTLLTYLKTIESVTDSWQSICMILLEKKLQRELLKASQNISASIRNENPTLLIDRILSDLEALKNSLPKKNTINGLNVALDYIKDRTEVFEGKKVDNEMNLGYYALNDCIIRDTDFWLIAARSGMGKTSSMTNFARKMLRKSGNSMEFLNKVGFISLEVEPSAIMSLILCQETQTDKYKIRSKSDLDLMQQKIIAKGIQLNRYEFGSNESMKADVSNISSVFEQLRSLVDKGCEAIFLDYFQLISYTAKQMYSVGCENRAQMLGHIANSLKAFSLKNKVPVIAGVQVNKEIDKRAGFAKRPMQSDIRESDAIANSADGVLGLFRPSFQSYQLKGYETPDGIKDERFENNNSMILEVNVLKNRKGRVFSGILDYDLPTQEMRDFDENESYYYETPAPSNLKNSIEDFESNFF